MNALIRFLQRLVHFTLGVSSTQLVVRVCLPSGDPTLPSTTPDETPATLRNSGSLVVSHTGILGRG